MPRSLTAVLSVSLTAALAAVALTACGSTAPAPTSTSSAADCQPAAPGDASASVTVRGDLGGALAVDASFPLQTDRTERSVLVDGSGQALDDGWTANLFYAIYNGATGELIEDSHDISTDPVPFVYESGSAIPGMESALRCSTAGSRVVAVIPPAEGFGADGLPDVGLQAGQSLLLVADILSLEETPTTSEPSATPLPTPSAWTTDIPAVDLTTSPPTVTIPDAPAPTDLVLTVLEEGDGAVVPNPATVTIDYHGLSWDTKEVFDSSYARGTPATFSTGGVITGFAAAIVGQKVGSTVLVSIPPDLAYGTDPAKHELGGQTLVFLIHIEAAQ
ncbi:MAG: hypothetical protein BGO95_11140 [Micrococcales bacterium 73-13]|nr:MAG: hypothetical protein BGO95_11140 [Micrococcales bacterium 73-13]